jgi:hypothetical protein
MPRSHENRLFWLFAFSHSFLSFPPSAQRDADTLKRFEGMDSGGNVEVAKLLEEMREHTEALAKQRKHEDPRLSFSTPEFKEFSRRFTDNFKKNFGKPIEWGLIKRFPWSQPQLEKLEVPVDHEGNPWPMDKEGKPILKEDQ